MTLSLRRSVTAIAALIAAGWILSACSSASTQEPGATGTGGTANSALAVETSNQSITVTNNAGKPIEDVRIAIKPFGKGLILEVLRHANEVRAAEPIFKEIVDVKIDKEALDLAKELVERKSGKFEPDQFKDQYNEAVWELIHAKLEKRAPEIVTEQPGTAKVINIMDALKKSVQQGKGGAPAKTAAKRGAASTKSTGKKTAKSTPKRKSA